MRILILGGSGMLGHQLWRHFSRNHETWVTLRQPAGKFISRGLFTDGRVIENAEMSDFAQVRRNCEELHPDVVLNCVGVIKQRKESKNPIPSLTLNALLPHHLAEICAAIGARLILFSTDCVFSGKRGGYTEADVSDADDLYGRTKFLGEVTAMPHVVTLRSSIIGRELDSHLSLIDWFLSRDGSTVPGYRRAIYSGFTTLEMTRIVERVLTCHPQLAGLWHVASTRISKFELLQLVKEKFGLHITLMPEDGFVCDRSLNADRFNTATGYEPPSWASMIEELASVPRNLPFS